MQRATYRNGENPQDTIDLSEAGQTWYIHSGIVDKSSPFYGDYINESSKGSNGGTSDTLSLIHICSAVRIGNHNKSVTVIIAKTSGFTS